MRITAAYIITLLLLFCGCGSERESESAEGGEKLKVAATVFPAYDFARAVLGESADITLLIRPGASVHSYDPSPADIIKISEADVFVYVGGENEEWARRVLSSADVSGKTLVRLMDYVEPVREESHFGREHGCGHEHAHEHGHEEEPEYDEHIWTSPENAALLVLAIAEGLCGAMPEKSDYFRGNAKAYAAEIRGVGAEIAETARNGKRNKIVMADRFALRYFTEEYGLCWDAAFGGCDDQSDASVAVVARLVDAVRDEEIPYVYYAELSTKNVARAVAGETGAGMLLLNSCQNVTKDEFEAGETYVSLMRQNAENLEKGLN